MFGIRKMKEIREQRNARNGDMVRCFKEMYDRFIAGDTEVIQFYFLLLSAISVLIIMIL
jgi:hypothetical protein